MAQLPERSLSTTKAGPMFEPTAIRNFLTVNVILYAAAVYIKCLQRAIAGLFFFDFIFTRHNDE